jgi:hypothetical protein
MASPRDLTTREQALPWAQSSLVHSPGLVKDAAGAGCGRTAAGAACSRAAKAGSARAIPRPATVAVSASKRHDAGGAGVRRKRYRASDHGQQQRQEQSRRYRQRRRQRQIRAAAAIPPCEGQRAASPPQDFLGRPCDRPGCYQLFVPTPRCPDQRFCSCSCRQALRRVRQRESRRRERRRQGMRPRRLRPRAPPGSTL